MTKNPEIPLFTAQVLLELALNAGKYQDLDRNIDNFCTHLTDLMNFDAIEVWYRDLPEDRNYYRLYKSQKAIVRTGVFEYKNKIAQFAPDQFCHTTTLKDSEKGAFAGFTDLNEGLIYTYKISPEALLIAYYAKYSSPFPESAFTDLYPIFQNFGLNVEQKYIRQKLEKQQISSPKAVEELQKYKLVVENVSEGLLICNLNQEVVFANNQLSVLSEYPTEEIIGKTIGKIILNDSKIPEVSKIIDKIFNGSSEEHAFEHIRKVSQTRWWATAKISPYKNKEGQIVGAIAIIRDITPEKLAQIALEESEERMSKFFDMSPIPVLIRSTKSLNFNRVNRKFTELFGYNLDELESLNRKDLVHHEDVDEIQRKMKQLLAGEISDFKIEKQYKRKDGSVFWGMATRSLVRVKGETLLIGFIEDITLQKDAIAAMKESEAKLRAIFDSTEDKIIAVDRHFKLIDFNKSGIRFFENYFHQNPLKIGSQYPPKESKYYDLWLKSFKEALEGNSTTKTVNYSYLNEERVDLVNILPIKDEKDNVIGITLYAKDITKLNNIQIALQKSESRLKEAQRIARMGNWEYDFDTGKIAWSEGTFRIFDMPTDAPSPTFEEYRQMLLPEDQQKLLDVMERTLIIGQPYEYEIQHFTKPGKMIYTIAKGEALMEGDRVVKIFGTVQDITSQKKVELELIESNNKYQDLFNNMYDALLVTDKNGYFLDANKAAQRLMEYSLEELRSIRFSDIVHPDDFEKYQKYFQKLYHEGYYSNYQGRIITKSGKVKYLQVNSNAIIEKGMTIGSRDIARDITALKEAEEKREQLYAKLEIANKELKDFAYIVSHDLKAPLRAIGSLSRWIAEDYHDLFDAEGQKHLSLLIGRANRMQKFIEGILQYSRLGRINLVKEPVNMRELLDTVIDSLAPPAQFKIIIDETIPVIACERIRIQQVFQNLISNAIKYNDKAQGIIQINYQASKEFHIFSIVDNGPGIEEKHFDKIFKIFQTLQARDQLESTGIGLTIVKRIVELHEGSVNVSSEPGVGSKFTFSIKK